MTRYEIQAQGKRGDWAAEYISGDEYATTFDRRQGGPSVVQTGRKDNMNDEYDDSADRPTCEFCGKIMKFVRREDDASYPASIFECCGHYVEFVEE